MMSDQPIESARFRPDDPDELVQASFACSYCLHQPTVATVEHGTDGAAVECCCHECERDWMVALTAEQSLRVQLRPPWRGMATVVHVPRA
jgi:hypothetical protein